MEVTVLPPDTSPFPTPLCTRYPYPMDSQKIAQQPLHRRRGAPLGSQNSRHSRANLHRHSRPRSGIQRRSRGPQQSGQKSPHLCQYFELFPIFLIFWAPFSLAALYIMLKQFPSQARHNSAVARYLMPNMSFYDTQNRLMSSGNHHSLPVCHSDGNVVYRGLRRRRIWRPA